MKHKTVSGWSLVELAFVLIIIAFLIAGVAAGSSLLAQARLKSIITEANNFTNSVNLFQTKYLGLPGDLTTASNVWGTACASTITLCNGNGDGHIVYTAGTTQVESFRAWQHLSLAGMVNGTYTGVATTTGQADIGVNVPLSGFNNAGWGFDFTAVYAPPTTEGQFLEIGGFSATNAANNPIMTPGDAYSIDMKIDDGFPRNGMVFGRGTASTSGCYPTGAITDTYNIALQTTVCNLRFVLGKF